MTKQLDKHSLFAYRVMQRAAQKAGGYPIEVGGRDDNIIVAGGAIRDLYFGHNSRDLDVYYSTRNIDPSKFAYELRNLNVNKMAREYGIENVTIVRLSDSSFMGVGGGDDEDWGDVSEDAKTQIDMWAHHVARHVTFGEQFGIAIMKAHEAVKTVNAILMLGGSGYRYAQEMLYKLGVTTNPNSANRSNSGSGSKVGKAHPLQSVEEFHFSVDGEDFIVELMGVKENPIDYVMTHFAVKLSRAYYDGKAAHFTPDFMQDARNKTITVACQVEQARFERLFSYYLPKIQSYYPDFQIRVDLDAMNSNGW